MAAANQERKSDPQDTTKRAPGAQASQKPSDSDNPEWALAAEKAKDAVGCASEMAGHAVAAVGNIAGRAVSDVGKRADEITANAGAGIEEWGDQIARNSPQEGVLGCASQAVAQTVKGGGQYLEEAKLSGLAEDLSQLIRQHPLPAVCIAMSLGWMLSGRIRG